MLSIYYRYCPAGRNRETRPVWFSEELCLQSLVLSLVHFKEEGGECNFKIIVDNSEGMTKKDNEIVGKYKELIGTEIDLQNFKSNTKSYQYELDLAINENQPEDVCFLIEDDYLFTEDAVSVLYTAYANLKCDYLTPYDHPVRYDHDFYLGADFPHWENKMYLSGNYHFRSQESTCMTFMASAKILKEDEAIHRSFSSIDNKCPNDRELFRSLQHLGNYVDSSSKKRLLLGPIPSVATHSHKDYLAPCIDWDDVAQKVLSNKNII